MNPKAGEFLLKVLGNPYARSAAGAVGGYAVGQLAGAAANTILPDQFDVDPNLLAGAGALAGGQTMYGGPGMKLFERAMSKYGPGPKYQQMTIPGLM